MPYNTQLQSLLILISERTDKVESRLFLVEFYSGRKRLMFELHLLQSLHKMYLLINISRKFEKNLIFNI